MLIKFRSIPIWNVLRASQALTLNGHQEGRVVKLYSTENKSCNPADKMTQSLRTKFPLAKHIDVVDVSGGCGSMYEIYVESEEFKGLSTIKQHRLINEVLKEDIKQMHGLRIQTKIPDGSR